MNAPFLVITKLNFVICHFDFTNNGMHCLFGRLMQGLLDRLVPLLGEQLLKDYHSWVQQQPQASLSRE
jgi:hypothetical protein